MTGTEASLTAVVVTWRRPGSLRRCVESLSAEDGLAQVVVVDASPDPVDLQGLSAMRLDYVHVPALAGRMTAARNVGLSRSVGDFVAFVDDDVTVRPGWARCLVDTFRETQAVALSGRAVDVGQPPAKGPVGQVLPDGRLAGNFSAELDDVSRVEHGLGANMAFDARALKELGGFRAIFGGTALREDTDVFLRLGSRGEVLFQPNAVVDHYGAPHVVGQRFDRRYTYWAKYNHVLLLLAHPHLRRRLGRWIVRDLADTWAVPGSLPRRALRMVLALVAMSRGGMYAWRLSRAGLLDGRGTLEADLAALAI